MSPRSRVLIALLLTVALLVQAGASAFAQARHVRQTALLSTLNEICTLEGTAPRLAVPEPSGTRMPCPDACCLPGCPQFVGNIGFASEPEPVLLPQPAVPIPDESRLALRWERLWPPVGARAPPGVT